METWTVKRDECIYTSCYCEENIWKLCESWKQNDPNHLDNLYAIFISNERRQIPIWKQKSGYNDYPVTWVLYFLQYQIDQSVSPTIIYDFDSTLPFPVSARDYLQSAIRDEINLSRKFHRMFRVIPAQEYLNTFASDRSHMLSADKITYNKPPPSYPAIFNEKSTNNINDFIDMKSKTGPGTVMNLTEFREFL
ncbi:unnamed protein product [Adineta steineri]|uniref:Protein N-terminal glutamine amidohydrolase n=1 Tax=Adineta steineri TaxID=433720 RepID=A0A818PQL7_9BILA|nr:unnamed protein product [Adineta steineri]CAF3624662.1 unnamed protein product [Adineta steineri]